MRTLAQDIRYALRMLRKNPGFAAVTVGVLALGIGANTAIFSVVNAVLLKPLPYPDAHRLVVVPHVPPQDIFPGMKTFSVSPANYFDWKAQNDVFEKMTILVADRMTLTGSGQPESVATAYVSADFFAVLGVRPLAGRLFASGDDEAGHRVAVLSEELWKTRFGSNPGAVGSDFVANGETYTVIGVLPAGRGFPEDSRLWVPLTFTAEERAVRGIHDFLVLARLKPGASVAGARAQMDAIAARLAAQYPADNKGWGATVIPLHEDLVGDVRPALLVLLGAVGLRPPDRVRERGQPRARPDARPPQGDRGPRGPRREPRPHRAPALRRDDPARAARRRARASWSRASASSSSSPSSAARCRGSDEIHVGGVVLAFTFVISLLTGALAGILPAWRLTHANPNEALKQGGRADADAGSPALRHSLVVAEVALALVLMFGAGLLVRSLGRLRGVDPGFNPKNVLEAQIGLPDPKYAAPEARRAFYDRVLERVRALPGVTSAAAMNTLPLTDGGSTQPIALEGAPRPGCRSSRRSPCASSRPARSKTLGIALKRGRDFTAADTDKSPPAILVSEAMAKKFWPGEDAVGKRLTLTFHPGVVREVVGVVADVKLRGLAKTAPIAALYVPYVQMPQYSMALVVRTAQDPGSVGSAVEAAVHAVDPDQPVVDMKTMEQHLGASLAHARFSMLLLSVFAALALLLSSIGIYSVLAYAVKRRTREIGIRMALGADGGDLVRMIVLQGMRPALIGLAVGIASSLLLGRLLAGLVFGIAPTDPLTFAAASAVLSAVALAACALPAWRATRVQPTEALQEG